MAANREPYDLDIVCVVVDDVRRCFSITSNRDDMAVCQDTLTKPATDLEWYDELLKQTTCDPETNAPMVRDW